MIHFSSLLLLLNFSERCCFHTKLREPVVWNDVTDTPNDQIRKLTHGSGIFSVFWFNEYKAYVSVPYSIFLKCWWFVAPTYCLLFVNIKVCRELLEFLEEREKRKQFRPQKLPAGHGEKNRKTRKEATRAADRWQLTWSQTHRFCSVSRVFLVCARWDFCFFQVKHRGCVL